MSSAGDIRAQVAIESERRSRLSVFALAGGFLYLLSAIIISETLKIAPTVGLLQGLAPALSGVAKPAVSARTAEVKFLSHHAFTLIAGGTLATIAFGALTLILLVLLDATRFRRPETFRFAGPLVIGGGIAVGLVSILRQVVSAVQAHSFAVSHDHSIHAAEQALTSGAANVLVDYLGLLATLALAAGMIATMINALRVGLIVRWMAILGMFVAVLIFIPIGGSEGQIVQAFWMVMMGVLYAGKWPKADPPAWLAGEARPWPSQARTRAAGRVGAGNGAPSTSAAEVVPAPVAPAGGGTSRKRRRKRTGRG
jgi:hypothetical protein